MALTQTSTNGIKDATIATADIAADAVTGAKIADDAIDSEHIADGSIDTAHIAADQITGAKIADDAVGSEHIEVLDAALQFGDSVKAQFGTSNDLDIYHDGTHSYIDNTTGLLSLRNGGAAGNKIYIQPKQGEYSINALPDGAVELYHDNSKQLETTAGGIKTYGGAIEISAPEGGDANIYMYADEGDDNADNWLMQAESDGFWALKNYAGGAWEKSIECNGNGNVELYYDNSKKLETTSTGLKTESSSDLEIHLLKTGSQDTLIKNTGQTEICAATGGAGGQRIVFKIGANTGALSDIARFTPDGLCFGSDTATANALYDYEEGTFTPSFSSGLTGSSYTFQHGQYTKIGRKVSWTLILHISSGNDTTDGNVINIDGFPFTCLNSSPYQGGGGTVFYHDYFYDSANGFGGIQIDNQTQLRLYKLNDGAYLSGQNVDGDKQIRMYGFYFTT